MSAILAIDPSLSSTGAAVYRHGKLVAAARIAKRTDPRDYIAARAGEVAQAIAAWALGVCPIDRVVFEWPQVYVAKKSKGNQNDIVPLAAIGQGAHARIDALMRLQGRSCDVLSPKPAEWIGQLPKSEDGDPWESPRGARIRSRLSPAELVLVPAQHDVIDAVGLGLWSLDRLEVARVFPGAT